MRTCPHCELAIDGNAPVNEDGEFCPHCTRRLKRPRSWTWLVWTALITVPALGTGYSFAYFLLVSRCGSSMTSNVNWTWSPYYGTRLPNRVRQIPGIDGYLANAFRPMHDLDKDYLRHTYWRSIVR